MAFISQALQLWQEVGPVILLQRFIRCFLYTFLCVYQFNVIDQIVGIEEDKINKPQRPLVTGAITVRQAWCHYIVSLALHIFYGYTEGLTGETLLWIGISVTLKLTECGKNGIWKNLLLAPGAYILYGVPYGYAYNITNVYDRNFHVWRTIMLFCIALPFVIASQDLRDVVGDRKSGMRTLPVLYGLRVSELISAGLTSMVLITILCYEYLFEPTVRLVSSDLYIILNMTILLIIIFRLLRSMNNRITYEFYFQLWLNVNCCLLPILSKQE